MELIITGLTAPVALAAVAVIGYLVGRARRRRFFDGRIAAQALEQAGALIEQMEQISNRLRQSMATHHSTVHNCREQIRKLSESHSADTDPSHHMHLQDVLGPADRLSQDIAMAYDELRRHSRALADLRSGRSVAG